MGSTPHAMREAAILLVAAIKLSPINMLIVRMILTRFFV